jgi:hypothetical protein
MSQAIDLGKAVLGSGDRERAGTGVALDHRQPAPKERAPGAGDREAEEHGRGGQKEPEGGGKKGHRVIESWPRLACGEVQRGMDAT